MFSNSEKLWHVYMHQTLLSSEADHFEGLIHPVILTTALKILQHNFEEFMGISFFILPSYLFVCF